MHCRPSLSSVAFIVVWGLAAGPLAAGPARLSIATFAVDATPPLGSPLCDGAVEPARKIDDPLGARGLVLLGAEQPIVLCAVDWVGIGNGGYDALREALADAAGTTADRVAVHALHQHDAPGCDFEAEAILADLGLGIRPCSTRLRPPDDRSGPPPRRSRRRRSRAAGHARRPGASPR